MESQLFMACHLLEDIDTCCRKRGTCDSYTCPPLYTLKALCRFMLELALYNLLFRTPRTTPNNQPTKWKPVEVVYVRKN
eukprot:1182735-Amphidinium_carterae.1